MTARANKKHMLCLIVSCWTVSESVRQKGYNKYTRICWVGYIRSLANKEIEYCEGRICICVCGVLGRNAQTNRKNARENF